MTTPATNPRHLIDLFEGGLTDSDSLSLAELDALTNLFEQRYQLAELRSAKNQEEAA